MANITWNGGSGDFGIASDWSTGQVPGDQDNALINVSGSNVSLNIYDYEEVDTLTMGSSTTLTLDNGIKSSSELFLVNGGSNAGTLDVTGIFGAGGGQAFKNSKTLNLDGSIDGILENSGSINANVGFNGAEFSFAEFGSDYQIIGDDSYGNYRLQNDSSGIIVTSVGVLTFYGTDAFGNPDSITNAGLIEAQGSGSILMDAVVSNTGTIASYNQGNVTINGQVNGGRVAAYDTSQTSIEGGAIGSTIVAVQSATLKINSIVQNCILDNNSASAIFDVSGTV